MTTNFNVSTGNVEELEKLNFALIEAIKELKDADAAYQKMVDVGIGSFFEYDRAWRDFLQSIDRVWNKTAAMCKGEKCWPKLKSKYERLRKTDPLLNYLIQARNVTEHTISPVVKEWDANIRAHQIPGAIRIEWDKWDRPLLPVTNRGVTFQPPKMHLGKPMVYYKRPGVEEPKLAAELAMYFYVGMLNEVSSKIFQSKS